MLNYRLPSSSQRFFEPIVAAAIIVFLVVNGVIALRNISRLHADSKAIQASETLVVVINDVYRRLVEAETGRRGFLLTGEERYLEPYDAALSQLDGSIASLTQLTRSSRELAGTVAQVNPLIVAKRQEMDRSIQERRRGGYDAATAIVLTDEGKDLMDKLRSEFRSLRERQLALIENQRVNALQHYSTAWWTSLLTMLAGLSLVGMVMLAVRWRRIAAERDAGIIADERVRLQNSQSERQKLEDRNRELDRYIRMFIEQIQDYAIFTMDNKFRATTWNSGVQKVLGFNELEFVGHDVRAMIFTPQANVDGTVEREFSIAAANGSSSDDRWMMKKDREQFWASGITTSLLDESDTLIGYSKVLRDMTAQKRSSEELSRLAAELSEESRRKNEFLATLAHELRNPLSPIKNAVQLMGMLKLNPELDELRAMMGRQVEQLVRLIDDLMDVSRIGRGKIELKKQTVEIAGIISAAVEASGAFIADNNQTLEVSVANKDACLHADPARIAQVICNLLNNASKYSDIKCRIWLSAIRESDDVVIRVKDNGSGIAADRVSSIFDMFSQIENTVERGSAGLGIGLTLVRNIVELHGGSVTVFSQGVGYGSEFTVRLPATMAVPVASELPSATPVLKERQFKILVVEDMQALALILSRLLTKLGHIVEVVDSGATAIEKLHEFTADVIFSDISMPGMTGYELAQKLRQNPSTVNVRLVAMTGYGQATDRVKALAAGFDEHMVKPVDIEKLREFFAKLCATTQLGHAEIEN